MVTEAPVKANIRSRHHDVNIGDEEAIVTVIVITTLASRADRNR